MLIIVYVNKAAMGTSVDFLKFAKRKVAKYFARIVPEV